MATAERVSLSVASAPLPAELDADSAFMDACRALRANLGTGDLRSAPAPLLLAATRGHAAMALLTAGLGLTLAEEGRATLLVDADLRAPSLHEVFGLASSPGLAEALTVECEASTTLVARHGLALLAAGTATCNPAELLRRPTAGRLMQELAMRFDAVVYHTPGLLAYPDALLLAAHVRVAVLIVQSGVDTVDELRRIKEPLERAGVSIAGFALLAQRSERRNHA
jgi:protein-tyrosine kinase